YRCWACTRSSWTIPTGSSWRSISRPTKARRLGPTEASDAQVLVAGGSLGGLMTAAMLHRQGIDVRVLERSRVLLHGRGAGIVTHSRLVQALRACGVPIDDTLGVRVPGRVV